jgi:hypothetical protein
MQQQIYCYIAAALRLRMTQPAETRSKLCTVLNKCCAETINYGCAKIIYLNFPVGFLSPTANAQSITKAHCTLLTQVCRRYLLFSDNLLH